MKRPLPHAFVVLLVGASVVPCLPLPARAGGRSEIAAGTEKKEKPRLKLSVEPAVGFTPVTALLTAHLSGVDPRDPNFCHAAVTWIRIDPGRTAEHASRIRRDPVCLHAEEDSRVPMFYTKTFTLRQPGSHLFKARIEGKDGKAIESGYARVRVLRVQ
ncbi:MAG: hypothetical protein ACE5JH_04555 [Acidobacteriota bacterium]